MEEAGSFPGSTHTPIPPNKILLVLVDHHFISDNGKILPPLQLKGSYKEPLCQAGLFIIYSDMPKLGSSRCGYPSLQIQQICSYPEPGVL